MTAHGVWPNGKPVTQENLDKMNELRDTLLALGWADPDGESLNKDRVRRGLEEIPADLVRQALRAMRELTDSVYYDHDLFPGQERL